MNAPQSNIPRLVNLTNSASYDIQPVTIVGRHEDCDLVLKNEKGASRKHARILVEDNVAVLMDLGSLNGTLVNGREIGRAVQLVDGDVIVFDQQEYQFVHAVNTPLDSSENVTVVANKDEVNHPESIKPAIRVVDQEIHDEIGSFDETEASEIPPVEPTVMPSTSQRNTNSGPLAEEPFDEFVDEPIAATSRPGGDTVRRSAPRARWVKWLVIVPLVLIGLLLAGYFAYQFGLASSSGS